MDRNKLKIEALRQKIGTLSATKEDEIADLRVELTLVTRERDELRKELEELRSQLPSDETEEGTDE